MDINSIDGNCIICLEALNDEIMDVCDTCKVKCHILCLYDWYKKNKCEICPICLKTEDNITVVNNRLNEIENEENNRENNEEESVRELETIIEINNNNDNNNNRIMMTLAEQKKCTCVMSSCICFMIFLLLIMTT